MNKIQCPQGHFYDADLYSQCPLCEKMENIGKISQCKSSKKSFLGKKTAPKAESVPEQKESVQRKVQNPPKRKKAVPAAGSVVTVAFYNTGNENGEQPDNSGILDDEGHLVLKAENKKRGKKEENREDYITAAEIIEEKKRKNLEKEEDKEPVSQLDELVIKVQIEDEKERTELETDTEMSDDQEETSSKEEKETADKFVSEDEKNNKPDTNIQDESKETDVSESDDAEQIYTEKNNVFAVSSGGSKTVGFYHFDTDPVVGWFVCLSGDIKGKSFKLKSGQNIIGTSGIMDIYLPSEDKTSEAKAILIFEPNKKDFIIRARSAQILINDKEVKEYSKIKDYDIITVCDYKLVFKSLCNKSFDWKDYE